MENRIDIDINDIKIITKKHEFDLFDYFCENRNADGFVYFVCGHGKFTDSYGKEYPITDSSVVLLSKGDTYRFLVDAGCEYITSAYTISKDASSSLASLPRVFISDEFTTVSLESINREWQTLRADSYMTCKLKLLSWYMHLISAKCFQESPHDQAVTRAIEFIHSNFKRNFSASELSLHCSQSISHLRVKFKHELGMGIIAYRNKIRITIAKEMLSNRLFSIKETAYELGYTDVHHFTKAFTKYVGISPGRYVCELTK